MAALPTVEAYLTHKEVYGDVPTRTGVQALIRHLSLDDCLQTIGKLSSNLETGNPPRIELDRLVAGWLGDDAATALAFIAQGRRLLFDSRSGPSRGSRCVWPNDDRQMRSAMEPTFRTSRGRCWRSQMSMEASGTVGEFRALFRSQMAYLLLWTAIERYVTLRWGRFSKVSADGELISAYGRVMKLATEDAFARALSKHVASGSDREVRPPTIRRRRRNSIPPIRRRPSTTTTKSGRTLCIGVRLRSVNIDTSRNLCMNSP